MNEQVTIWASRDLGVGSDRTSLWSEEPVIREVSSGKLEWVGVAVTCSVYEDWICDLSPAAFREAFGVDLEPGTRQQFAITGKPVGEPIKG